MLESNQASMPVSEHTSRVEHIYQQGKDTYLYPSRHDCILHDARNHNRRTCMFHRYWCCMEPASVLESDQVSVPVSEHTSRVEHIYQQGKDTYLHPSRHDCI